MAEPKKQPEEILIDLDDVAVEEEIDVNETFEAIIRNIDTEFDEIEKGEQERVVPVEDVIFRGVATKTPENNNSP